MDLQAQSAPPRRFKAGEELRARLLDAASRLFGVYGIEHISIRQIAQEAGCSQMAMYRHFPDKQTLLRHLCAELYRRFTLDLHAQYDAVPDPRQRLRMALRSFVLHSAANPHHYRLTFLEPSQDEGARRLREECSAPAIQYFRDNLRLCLPAGAPDSLVDERLHQIVATLHGVTVMLLVNPHAYQLEQEQALQLLDTAFAIFLSAPTCSQEEQLPAPKK